MERQIRKYLTEGQSVVVEHSYSQDDFDQFALLSGDDNPIHVDPEFAARTRFGRTVCHGMLLYSTICTVLGKHLPGPGVLQLWQELMFTSPTFAGEVMQFKIEVVEISDKDETAHLSTDIIHQDGTYACRGSTLVTMNPKHFPRNPTKKGYSHVEEDGYLRGLRIGQQAAINRTFRQEELDRYVDLTGDTNPINMDPHYAGTHAFKEQVIPAGLLGGMFSTLLGTRLPGKGTMWLKQRFDYWLPAHPEEQLSATVEIVRLRPDKDLVDLHNVCKNSNNQLICTGESLVLVRDLQVVV
jgi:acyl dehydratase